MKFSTKKFGSIATAAVLAGTMAFMPVAAIAGEATTTTPANYGNSQKIEKTYNYGNTPLAAQTFTFDLNYDSSKTTQIGSNTPQDPTLRSDKDDKATITITTPATDDTPLDQSVSGSTSLLNLVNEYNFSAPGRYYFTLSEEASTNPNIASDSTTYTVRVDVVWNANYSATTINGIALFKNTNGVAGDTKQENANFSNTSNAATGNFTVSKTVSGTAANTNDYFKYTLQLTNTTQVSGDYVVKKTGTDETVATLNANNSYTVDFYLKSGESVYVIGLPKGAAYKVTESEDTVNVAADGKKTVTTTNNGYNETYKLNGAETPTSGNVVTSTVQDGATTVAFNNEKGFIPQTGITMNTLPFAVVATVAVAGGAALVISRRRHAGEDF